MVFSSLIFLYIFLPATLFIYYLMPREGKNVVLLLFSLLFYAWGEPVYVLGIIASVIVNYILALVIESLHKKESLLNNKNYGRLASAVFILSIVLNISYLAVFKYTDFAIGTLNKLFGTDISLMNIALPIGVSFYTFQALSYVTDVYKGSVKANKNIVEFATYITMFPQLIAGPIVRYKTVAYELRNKKITLTDISYGIKRFVTGLGKKVLLANTIGEVWDIIRDGQMGDMTTLAAWTGMISFTLQIYFDFSGYSDMAIGLGRMLGFHFDENFDLPYISHSVTEFWRRWHISLSTWFKEYVYIPLGGNKKGPAKQIINIIIVWTLTGLWHGAAWSFVLWGLYYAMILIAEKLFFKKILSKIPSVLSWILTMIIVIGGWGIFGLADIEPDLKTGFVKAVFFMGDNALTDGYILYIIKSHAVFIIVGAMVSIGIFTKISRWIQKKYKILYTIGDTVYMIGVMAASTVCIVADTYNPFLYFRF